MTIIASPPEVEQQQELNIEVGEWGMDPSLKQRWVTALRSGKYKQTTVRFQRRNKLCALGVLCVTGGQPTTMPEGCGNWDYVRSVLPVPPHDISEMNDRHHMSFSAIADWIDANL